MNVVNVMLARGKGGMETVALQYAQLLSEAGFASSFLCHRKLPYDIPADIRPMRIASASRWNPLAYLAILKSLRSLQPDLVFCHGARAVFFCKAVRAFLPRKTRLIGVAHNGRTGKLKGLDKVIAVSRQVFDSLVNRWKIPQKSISCIPNAIRIPKATSTARHTPPVVGFLGRMDPVKGVDTLLDAAALLKDNGIPFRLLMAGSGPQERHYRERCRELGLDSQTTWPGWVEDKKPFFDAVDLFCLPSQSEGMSLSLVEAMAFGRPAVGSDHPAIKALIDDSGAGTTFPIGDASALAQALERMLSKSNAEYMEHSNRGREFAIRKFSEDRLREDLKSLTLPTPP